MLRTFCFREKMTKLTKRVSHGLKPLSSCVDARFFPTVLMGTSICWIQPQEFSNMDLNHNGIIEAGFRITWDVVSAVSPKGDAPTAEVEELERSLLAAAAPGQVSAFFETVSIWWMQKWQTCSNVAHTKMTSMVWTGYVFFDICDDANRMYEGSRIIPSHAKFQICIVKKFNMSEISNWRKYRDIHRLFRSMRCVRTSSIVVYRWSIRSPRWWRCFATASAAGAIRRCQILPKWYWAFMCSHRGQDSSTSGDCWDLGCESR